MKIIKLSILFLIIIIIAARADLNYPRLDSLEKNIPEKISKERIDILLELGGIYLDLSLPKMKEKAQTALKESELINYSYGKARANRLIGIYYTLTGDYKLSKVQLYKSLSHFKELNDKNGIGLIEIALGNLNKRIFKYDEAFSNYNNALEIFQQLNDTTRIAILYNNLGRLFFTLGDENNALNYYEQAYHLSKITGNRDEIARYYDHIASYYFQKDKDSLALIYYLKAEKICKEISDIDGLSVVSNNIGLAYQELKRFEEAEKYFKKSLEYKENIENSRSLAMTYMNLGNLYIQTQDYNLASENLTKSMNLFSEVNDQSGIADCHLYFGVLFENTRDFELAKIHLRKALDFYEEIENYVEVARILDIFSNIAIDEDNYKIALEYKEQQTRAIQKYREMDIDAHITAINNLTKIREKLIETKLAAAEQKQDIRKLSYITIFFIVSGILLLTIIVVYYVKHRQLRIKNEELQNAIRFHNKLINTIDNELKSALYPLSINISKVDDIKSYTELNDSYMNFKNEFDSIIYTLNKQISTEKSKY